MLSVPTLIADLIDTGRFSIRWMLRFDLDSGATGIWTDTYAVTHEGVDYAPLAGNLIFDAIPGSVELAADRVVCTVSNLLPAVTTVIASEDWHQRPASLLMAILDDAGNVQHVMQRFSGFCDGVEIRDAADDTVTVEISIESNNRELNRSSGRTRSDADQRRVLVTDGFFKHAAAANANPNITWGSRGTQQPPQKKPSFLGRLLSKLS